MELPALCDFFELASFWLSPSVVALFYLGLDLQLTTTRFAEITCSATIMLGAPKQE